MVQLNLVPVFGDKKIYQYYLTGIFHWNFYTKGKRPTFQSQQGQAYFFLM